MQQDIAQRYHADEMPFVAHRQMAKTMTPHERHAVFNLFHRRHGQRIIGHDLGHAGAASIAAFGHNAAHQVAFRENADQFSVVNHRNGTDVAPDHFAHGL